MPKISIPKIDFSKQTREMTKAINDEVARAAISFHSDIIRAWPVDTGFSRGAWEAPVQIKPGEWSVSNSVNYAPILWGGVHTVGEKTIGSIQLPAGGAPILEQTNRQLLKNLGRL